MAYAQTQSHPCLKILLSVSLFILASLLLWLPTVTAQGRGGVLRIGMTASDIPNTAGQPDQGGEGLRFVGYQMYDALVNWDLRQGDRPAELTPGLAERWEVRPDDPTKWIFYLRQGVKFHDGTDFNADAVIWNLDKVKNKEAPQYDPKQAAEVIWRAPLVKSWRKLDDYTVEITTTRPSSTVLFQVCTILYSSPAQWEKMGRDWSKVAMNPAGTGPFKLARLLPRERVELEPFAEYWDKRRVPKVDKLMLFPMPESTTRMAALRTGQVDFIEVPPPDAISGLKRDGFQIVVRPYPHNWPYSLNLNIEPWNNKLVRQAANYAIDREGLCKALLNETCMPATGAVYPGHPWFGQPKQEYSYNPQKAKELLKQAGYGGKRLKTSVLTSTSGSGQMMPLPMNEFIQENWREVGIDLEIIPLEWNTLRTRYRKGFRDPENANIGMVNVSFGFAEPFSAFTRFFHSDFAPPKSTNLSPYVNAEVDRLLDQSEVTFDPAERDRLLAQVNEIVVDDAPWIFIVHDLNPRALSPKVKGFVQAQSWYQDLTLPWVEK
jgi:peptide/nickel transport system substrate-binding protein